MSIPKSTQRSRTETILTEFRQETRCDGVMVAAIIALLELDKMTQAQLRGLEMILNHALACLCEVKEG